MYHENTVLLFPSVNARPVTDIDWSKIRRIDVVDATWSQAQAMTSNISPGGEQDIICVKLTAYETGYWRYNDNAFDKKTALSTAEAIYFLFR